MKCEKCGNEYNSQYYFATPTVCNDCFSKLTPEEQESLYAKSILPVQVNGYPDRVGFGKRLAAAIIDYLIVAIITVIIFKFSGFFSSFSQYIDSLKSTAGDVALMQQLQKEFMDKNTINFYFSIIISLAYFSLEILVAASLGKLLLGISIAGSDKRRAPAVNLVIRYLIKHAVNIFSIVWLLTGYWIFNTLGSLIFLAVLVGFFFTLSEKKQAFHDMIAKTAVYKKDAILDETGE